MLNKEAGVHLGSAVTLEQWKMGFFNVCSSLLVLHRLPWALWTFSILTPLRYGIAINTINMWWRDNKFKRVRAQNDTCNTDLRSGEVLFFQIDSLGSAAPEISVFFLSGYFLLSETLHTSCILDREIFEINLGTMRADCPEPVAIMQKFNCVLLQQLILWIPCVSIKNHLTADHEILA